MTKFDGTKEITMEVQISEKVKVEIDPKAKYDKKKLPSSVPAPAEKKEEK